MEGTYKLVGFTGPKSFTPDGGSPINYAAVYVRREGSSDVVKFKVHSGSLGFDFSPYLDELCTLTFVEVGTGLRVTGAR